MKLVKKSKRVRLKNLPNGTIFTVKGWDSFAFKSEYRTTQGACECYIFDSGEMFWGGCKTADELNNLLVIPIEVKEIDNCG
jgi:hypothetical protein